MAGPIITTKFEGGRELDEALGELTKATAKNVLRRVAKKALQLFDAAWRAAAPRLTGQLADSGGVGEKLTSRQQRLNKRRDDKDFVEMYAGPNDVSAVPQEFGTANDSPQPFARPAWEDTKEPMLHVVATELGTEIDKAAKRAAARALRKAVLK